MQKVDQRKRHFIIGGRCRYRFETRLSAKRRQYPKLEVCQPKTE